MGLSLFQIKKGLNIDGLSQVLPGSGVPGAAGDTAAAPKGSVYLDSANGQLYVKKTAGSGTDKWVRIQDKGDMDAAMQGISWREPVKVRVNTAYADLAAATTAMNTGTLDGQTIVANDRILFDNITGANKNVFVVTGTPGSGATLVEDANALTKGDTVYVNAGTDAGKTFNYNGTVWVQQGGASSTEIGYLKTFVGKSADGNEMPDYSSNNVVTDGNSLEAAIGEIDSKIGQVYVTPNFINNGDTVSNNLATLDSQVFMARKYVNLFAGGGTVTVVDSMQAQSGDYCIALEWSLVVKLQSDTSRLWAAKVFAVQNGTAVDFNIASILGIGTAIPGLDVSVDISGGNVRLLVNSTDPVIAYATRSMVGNVNT
jgi:hypothetical protein